MLNGKTITALLPIKANSERVKGKNFRNFAGKPLFQWILDSLLEIQEIDKIVINTDARQLIEACGVKENSRLLIRDRKKELQGDLVSMNLILGDDIKAVKSDVYLMTHATNPLLSSNTISAALDKYLLSDPHDSLFTVNKVQTRFYRNDMSAVNHDPDNLIPTQELEPWYEENSCLYIFSADSFSATNARIGKDPIMYETPGLESSDIDEEDDWFIAEALANKLAGESR